MAQSQMSCSENDGNIGTLSPSQEQEFIGEEFSTLLKSSSTLGTHFRFSAEKQWNDTKNFVMPSYFALNVESLANNLSKIPFLIRHQIKTTSSGIDSCMEIHGISHRSRSVRNSIALCLEKTDNSKNFKLFNSNKNVATDHVQLSSSLESPIKSTSKDSIPTNNEPKEIISLDDWLDSVLDD